ncbi:MAG: DNA gyrase modulator, partial [Acidobacteriota bacterium]
MRWDRDEAKKTIERILALAGPGEWEAELSARTSSHTRFARNEISTSGFVEDVDLGVTARQDGRSGTVGTNDLSTSGLKAAIARAAEMRDLMPVDPEAVEMLPAQKYPALEKYDDATALARAADRAHGVKATLGLAQRRSLTSAGFFENGVSHRAIGNSRGNFGYHLSTEADFSVTMRTADGTGSGWAAG